MPNGTYGGVRGRKTKVGRKLLRFPPTRLLGFSIFVRFLMSVMPGLSYSFCWLGTNDYFCMAVCVF